jgi:hypothetical protein
MSALLLVQIRVSILTVRTKVSDGEFARAQNLNLDVYTVSVNKRRHR